MRIKNIIYPTTLEKIPDRLNDNIDIFVETDEEIYFLSGDDNGAFSQQNLNRIIEKYSKENYYIQ